MNKNNVFSLTAQGKFDDPLTDVLREGARRLLTHALEIEVEEFLADYRQLRTPSGRRAVVRNGYQPQREIQTGIGPISVRIPKTRSHTGEPVTFRSALVPPYVRKSATIEAFVPWLFLKGVSSGEMADTLKVLIGPQADGFSASSVTRLSEQWNEEMRQWEQRDLSDRRFVYIWADGIYCGLRDEASKLCALVVIGVDEHGVKHLLAIADGERESMLSWCEVLLDLKRRGLRAPKLAIGDGAMGFWAALDRVFPETIAQRCWVHKCANVLNRLPKSLQPRAKQALQQIWMAETREAAHRAFTVFVDTYQDKYPKAVEILQKDYDSLLAFYDFPASHWQSIRTTNPIESVFATIRHRTNRSKGCLSRRRMLCMMYKLGLCAQNKWRRLRGFKELGKVIEGVKFKDGIQVEQINDQVAA